MCVYQSYVYIFVLTYAMQVMRELNRFLLKHYALIKQKQKTRDYGFSILGVVFEVTTLYFC